MAKQITCSDCTQVFEFTDKDQAYFEKQAWKDPKRCKTCRIKRRAEKQTEDPAYKNYNCKCQNCDQLPTVGDTGLCGPCCWGEAETVNGNW